MILRSYILMMRTCPHFLPVNRVMWRIPVPGCLHHSAASWTSFQTSPFWRETTTRKTLSGSYECLDASRPWLCYWILHSLSLLDHELSEDHALRIAAFLGKCQHRKGGFAGGPGQFSHLAPTYAAVNALCILSTVTEKVFDYLDRPGLYHFLTAMRSSDGAFKMHEGGEVDIRGVYCAASAARLTNMCSKELFAGTAEWIRRHGYDFRDDDQVDKTAVGHYSTNLFTDRAVRIINQHDTTKPFFLYLAYQAVHGPLEVPQSYVDDHCSHISDHDRKIKCGMIAALDEGVHNVTQALQNQGLMNNTFIVFSSDNGGPVHVASSNWPLRGSKITIWEGGTRAVGFVHAPGFLQTKNSSYEELLHITDWYPTFVEAAGGHRSVPNIDGVSQWESLQRGSKGPRHEFIYNINEVKNYSANRQGRFKLIQGHPRNPNDWFVTPELEAYVNATTEEVPHGSAHKVPYQLYNLHRDPWERNNIIDTHQDVFRQMKARLDEYRKTLVPTQTTDRVHAADPSNFDGNWSPG